MPNLRESNQWSYDYQKMKDDLRKIRKRSVKNLDDLTKIIWLERKLQEAGQSDEDSWEAEYKKR